VPLIVLLSISIIQIEYVIRLKLKFQQSSKHRTEIVSIMLCRNLFIHSQHST